MELLATTVVVAVVLGTLGALVTRSGVRGLVFAVVGILVLGFLYVLALPDRPRSLVLMNETGAVGDCRSVSSAEVAYSSSNGGAFGTLSCLGNPTSCGFPAGTAPFLDSNIASLNVKQGYARSFVAGIRGSGKPDTGVISFVYVARPVTVGKTGKRGFAIDSSGLLCFTTDGSSPPIVNAALAPTCNVLK